MRRDRNIGNVTRTRATESHWECRITSDRNRIVPDEWRKELPSDHVPPLLRMELKLVMVLECR